MAQLQVDPDGHHVDVLVTLEDLQERSRDLQPLEVIGVLSARNTADHQSGVSGPAVGSRRWRDIVLDDGHSLHTVAAVDVCNRVAGRRQQARSPCQEDAAFVCLMVRAAALARGDTSESVARKRVEIIVDVEDHGDSPFTHPSSHLELRGMGDPMNVNDIPRRPARPDVGKRLDRVAARRQREHGDLHSIVSVGRVVVDSRDPHLPIMRCKARLAQRGDDGAPDLSRIQDRCGGRVCPRLKCSLRAQRAA
ncbi:MAG TPA: hypothetical protein VLK58_02770 [Conexibacter sp.]|nr:hypothetical protein [Conexibacter sp.]